MLFQLGRKRNKLSPCSPTLSPYQIQFRRNVHIATLVSLTIDNARYCLHALTVPIYYEGKNPQISQSSNRIVTRRNLLNAPVYNRRKIIKSGEESEILVKTEDHSYTMIKPRYILQS